ncbi:MAG: MFS transporter [Bacillota bacterium]
MPDRSENLFRSFHALKGNARIAVLFQPLWGLPYFLYKFYLSLYMMSQGVTKREIGYLISLGFIFGALFSFFSGIVTDAWGRRMTTLIFDMISWPGAVLFYLIGGSYWIFVLATLINSTVRIVSVSWNLMIVEDADRRQQVGAFNWLNIINISTGVLTPLAGLLVLHLGIIRAEKILLVFAAVSMSVMIIARHHYFRETKIGLEILKEHREKGKALWRRNLYRPALDAYKGKPDVKMASWLLVLFNAYLPVGTFNSLYFAPYLTEVLKLDKSAISFLGGVLSLMMLLVFSLVMPVLSKRNHIPIMVWGILLQILSLTMMVFIPRGHFLLAVVSVAVFATGYAVTKPFIDTFLADVTSGRERAGVFALNNTITMITSAVFGFVSGYLYDICQPLIYIASIAILLVCICILTRFHYNRKMKSVTEMPSAM